MRNVLEYPVTKEEIVECLQRFADECDPNLIGDMRPLLLREACDIISKADYSFRLGV